MRADGSTGPVTRVRRVGEHALLIEAASEADVAAITAAARERLEATDVVPAARSVLIDGIRGDAAAHASDIEAWSIGPTDAQSGPLVELPVVFDGEDLDHVARLWGASGEAVVAQMVGVEFAVAFCGFAPGFGYLTGLPPDLAVPRRADPRTRVPAGSVGLAGPYAGVYPRESPGGWQLLGRLAAAAPRLWDTHREPPALLAPGTRVRFVQVRA
ncbi:5-oxoprolinase subunit B family protein [Demequina activiva]|uniref:Allophanate hydrolase n=1 Tax=Demequina activiva TaxID=1582364 RepID=A0A919Q3S4_9MICO|nr:allophanate hydrolase subunit 1 [Demequina activiva]GIG53918.1 allophanate hydrolase [Demequina activiva]